jgi:hypothetical protein
VRLTDSPSAVVYKGQIYVLYQGGNNDFSMLSPGFSDFAGDALVPNTGMSGGPGTVIAPFR